MARQRVFLEVGQRFGRGVVIDPEIRLPLTEGRKKGGSKLGPRGALMQCDCGNLYKAIIGNLTHGSSSSCGCRRVESLAEMGRRNTRHGLSKHPHFPRWRSMVDRCHDSKNPNYPRYGGRGITVADAWRDPAAFIAYLESELGPCPSGHSLDRIDNDGNYEPGNIRWADGATQRRNQRPSSGSKNVRTHCFKGHEFSPENTIRARNGGRRCRRCRNESALSRNRAERLRARRTQNIPTDLLNQLISVAERASPSDHEARRALASLELMRLYDMPIDVSALPEAISA
jgi:hypothetical protein